MIYDYNELLRKQLYALRDTLGLGDQEFFVDSEQSFIKNKDLKPGAIYVLTKDLQNDISIGVETQPIQVLILSEQNSLEVAKAFFREYAQRYNFLARTESDGVNTTWIKQQYSEPVVLSNFNTVSFGYRSVLYMSATFFVMKNVADLVSLDIDDVDYKVLTWDMTYNMTPNTQQLGSDFISTSVKSVSSLAITITIPAVESALLRKVMSIINESDVSPEEGEDPTAFGGNEDFIFDFQLGSYQFDGKKMKLTMVDFGAAVDNVPAIRLGFIK